MEVIPVIDASAREPTAWSRVRAAAPAVFVWSIWMTATLLAICYIGRYTRNVPIWEDFTIVPVMTGHEPLTLQWASAQWNEHRPVVPRLILATVLRKIRDFRAGRYLNVGILSLAAASMIVLVRRSRPDQSPRCRPAGDDPGPRAVGVLAARLRVEPRDDGRDLLVAHRDRRQDEPYTRLVALPSNR